MKIRALLITVALASGLCSEVFADTAATLNTETARMNTLTASHGETNATAKIGGEFNSFLGSNSNTVVNGLRNGSPITLTTTTLTSSNTPGAAPIPTTTTTIINPPTGKMGYGNVFTSLALAKQQLGQLGISQPTPQQLQAALTGGTITTGTGTTATTTNLQGILTMRSQHMGWGQIAHKLGTKLGPVVSGLKSANQNMTTATASSAGTQSATSSGSGIVSGSGKSYGNSGQGGSGQDRSGEGIVSASGRSGGNGNAHGKGIVSGSGQAVGGNTGITTAGGRGNSSGQGKGQSK
jgi:hypothetical protein